MRTLTERGATSGYRDPKGSRRMRIRNTAPRRRGKKALFPTEILPGSAERIPLAGSSVDAVLTTWSLCTIPDAGKRLKGKKRVLKADGQLIFVGHGRAPD